MSSLHGVSIIKETLCKVSYRSDVRDNNTFHYISLHYTFQDFKKLMLLRLGENPIFKKSLLFLVNSLGATLLT